MEYGMRIVDVSTRGLVQCDVCDEWTRESERDEDGVTRCALCWRNAVMASELWPTATAFRSALAS